MRSIIHLLKKGLVLSGFALFSYSTLMAQTTTDPSPEKEKVFYIQTEINLIQGHRDIGESTALGLAVNLNYALTEYFSAGIGAAWENFDLMDVLPLYAHLTGSLKPSGNTPFLYADIGYGWVWANNIPEWVIDSEDKGGLALRSGVGYTFSGTKGIKFNIHAGFLLQKSSVIISQNGWATNDNEIKEDRTRKRFTTGFSFEF